MKANVKYRRSLHKIELTEHGSHELWVCFWCVLVWPSLSDVLMVYTKRGTVRAAVRFPSKELSSARKRVSLCSKTCSSADFDVFHMRGVSGLRARICLVRV